MLKPVLPVALALVACMCAQSGFGQTMDRNSFENKVYSIEAISHFGLDENRFAALTNSQKRDVVESRDDLIAVLRAIETKGDARAYVTSDMLRKYTTSKALAASLLDSETSVLAAGVSDFELIDVRNIKLHFFAVVSSEGDIVTSEKSAILRRTDSGWRVAAFE